MSATRALHQIKRAFLTLLVATGLVACGGGGSTTDTTVAVATPDPVATVTLLLTDAPSDEFDEINITITSIELLGGNGPVLLYEGEETVNILALENFADLFSITDDVPAGSYSKIRLRITDLELLRLDADGNVLESIHPDLPSNGKIDLNPRGSFEIVGGENIVVQLDIDARKSIHIVGTGNGRYRFRPVVFIDRIGDGHDDGKATRVNGTIMSIDAANSSFNVCQSRPSSSSRDNLANEDHCITVVTNAETGIFDAAAMPVSFADLRVDDKVTVIGKFAMSDVRVFEAVVVATGEEGTFRRIEGLIESAVDANNEFTLLVSPGQGFAEATLLNVELQSGTGITDEDGGVIDAAVIQPGLEAEVEGLIILSDTSGDVIKAIYVTVDNDDDDDNMDEDEQTRLAGEILTVDASTDSFTLADDTGDRCVVLDDDAEIFSIMTDGDSTVTSSIALSADLSGAQADLYGEEQADGCFEANTVLVFQ